MADLDSALKAQRIAAEAFKSAARKVPESVWNVPRAEGKWSPAQVTDHVGHTTKLARDAVGEKADMGGLPSLLRPLARRLFLMPVLKKGFPKKSRSPAIFNPAPVPGPRDQLITRIDTEVTTLESEVRAMDKAGKNTFNHGFFGRVVVADYVMFNALHFDHHREQLPGA